MRAKTAATASASTQLWTQTRPTRVWTRARPTHSISRVPLGAVGATPEVLARPSLPATVMTTDGTYVHWVSGGSLYRLAK